MITLRVGDADSDDLPPILPSDREWLLTNIRRAGGRLESVAVSGEIATKGIPDLYSLYLPAAAVPAVAQIIRIWLKERKRSIIFQVSQDDAGTTYKLTGSVSDATVREVLTKAIDHQPDSNQQP